MNESYAQLVVHFEWIYYSSQIKIKELYSKFQKMWNLLGKSKITAIYSKNSNSFRRLINMSKSKIDQTYKKLKDL